MLLMPKSSIAVETKVNQANNFSLLGGDPSMIAACRCFKILGLRVGQRGRQAVDGSGIESDELRGRDLIATTMHMSSISPPAASCNHAKQSPTLTAMSATSLPPPTSAVKPIAITGALLVDTAILHQRRDRRQVLATISHYIFRGGPLIAACHCVKFLGFKVGAITRLWMPLGLNMRDYKADIPYRRPSLDEAPPSSICMLDDIVVVDENNISEQIPKEI